jgi:uncharacterized protein (TIGR02588 family)
MNKNFLEWTVFALSLALIAGVAGLLLRQHLTGSQSPPSLSVASDAPMPAGDGYAVPLDVRNDGGTTAEEVRIEARLTWPGGEERGETVLDYVPYQSRRRAWITFSRDPRQGQFRTRVLGYREP